MKQESVWLCARNGLYNVWSFRSRTVITRMKVNTGVIKAPVSLTPEFSWLQCCLWNNLSYRISKINHHLVVWNCIRDLMCGFQLTNDCFFVQKLSTPWQLIPNDWGVIAQVQLGKTLPIYQISAAYGQVKPCWNSKYMLFDCWKNAVCIHDSSAPWETYKEWSFWIDLFIYWVVLS